MYKVYYFFILLYFCYDIFYSTVYSQAYGPFNVTVAANEYCKGPKRKNCCEVTTKMINNVSVRYDFKISENIEPVKAKITAIIKNKELWTLTIKDPCNHMLLGPLMHSEFVITKDCVILKGRKTFVIDIQEFAQRFHSGTFVYGNLTFKSVIYNGYCNVICDVTTITLHPVSKKN